MRKSSKTDSFQLKADFLPITTLRLLHRDNDLLQAQLENTVLKAPQYFANAPMIIDFTGLENEQFTQDDIKQICSLMRQYQIQPIAARGLPDQTIMPNLTMKPKPVPEETHAQASVSVPATKIITKPVRAGTQIYAKGTDLIILTTVNAGAEVVADGNIHIYGALRGRALAGASGDTNAKIFCQTLDAELIAIAGHYLLNDKMKSHTAGNGMVHVFLDNDVLQIENT